MRRTATALVVMAAVVAAAAVSLAPQRGDAVDVFRVGFAKKAITPVGEPPAEWRQYLTPHPKTGVWSEPFQDLNNDGCMSGLTNNNLEPVLDAQPPRGELPEPHTDQPWNSTGDAHKIGLFGVRGVTIVGDPDSTGKWDGLWANAGFGAKCTLGMHDDTWARAIVLESGETTVAVVSLDVVGFFNVEIRRARAEMKVRYPAMPVDELIVSSTHTHEGVDTMGYWGQLYLNTDGKFPAYQAFIRSQIIDAVYDAWTGREAARAKFVNAPAPPVAIRDSRPPIVTDPAVITAQYVRALDGSTIGSVVNWSNHPEAQGSNNAYVSSDFAHGTRVTLEQALGGTAVYFSGSVGGLQTPLGVNVPGFGSSPTWERTFEIGRQVAQTAIDALSAADVVDIPAIEVKRRSFYFESDNTVIRALNTRGIFDIPTYIGGESWGPESQRREGIWAGTAGQQIQTEMIALTMGPAMFLTVPGEMAPEIELGGYGRPECAEADTGRPYEPVIRDQFPHPYQFVLGLAQDELGYIIPGYDFHLFSAPEDVTGSPVDDHDGVGAVPVGALDVKTCGEGHYEETVSASSVLAPWVACVAKELAGRDPWSNAPENAACSYDNTHLPLNGIGG